MPRYRWIVSAFHYRTGRVQFYVVEASTQLDAETAVLENNRRVIDRAGCHAMREDQFAAAIADTANGRPDYIGE